MATILFDREEKTTITYQLTLNGDDLEKFKKMTREEQQEFCELRVNEATMYNNHGVETDEQPISDIQYDK